MIYKNMVSQDDIKRFFNYELNTLDQSLGIVTFNQESLTLSFDALSLKIFSIDNLKQNELYTIQNTNIPTKLKECLLALPEDIEENHEFLYSTAKGKEITFKFEPIDSGVKIYVISMELLLQTEKNLKFLNMIFESSKSIFSVSTWWIDYDRYSDHFYQTDDGVSILGVPINENQLYNTSEFQKVREKTAEQSPFYDDCVVAEQAAYELVRSNETDYFGGRTPASTVDNKEVWVEAYGKCIIRYKDGRPRFFVAVDIYLDDYLERSNQLEVLNSLLNQGLTSSNVGVWYYNKFNNNGRYHFTDSHLKLMRVTGINNENISDRLDHHFAQIVEHTSEYQTYLVDWRTTHQKVFTEGLDSYTKVIPNSLDKDNPQWIEVRGSVLERDADGEVKLFVGVNVDVTETVTRNRELEQLKIENDRLQLAEKLAIKAGNVLVWFQDFDNPKYDRYIYGNEMFTTKLGIDRDAEGLFRIAALRKTIIKTDNESKNLSRDFIEKLNSVYTNQRNSFHDKLVKHKNPNTGEIFYFEHTVEIEERYDTGEVKLIGGFMRDVTEQVEKQKRIAFLANNDILTGLRNRNFFDTFISSGALPSSYSVLLFDLDGLKLINDAFGHFEGDRAIKQVAKFLIEIFEDNLFISRIGGDEFLVLSLETDPVVITDRANILEAKLEKYNSESSIEINVSKGGYVVEDSDVDFERAFAHAENLMYRRKLMNRSSRKSKVLDSIIETLNQKTEETKEHSDRIEEYCINISKQLGITRSSDLEDLRLLAKVHDVGKITIPDTILNKPGRLTEDEFELIKKHSEAGYKIIKNITDSDFVCEAVLSHHEKFDGTGYPQGLKGKEIPLFARIISVADAFDAMTNDRAYHKAISEKEAIQEIIDCSGTHFDPDIVQAFLKSNFNVDLE